MPNSDLPHECPVCKKICKSRAGLTLHKQSKHFLNFKCKKCGWETPHEDKLLLHKTKCAASQKSMRRCICDDEVIKWIFPVHLGHCACAQDTGLGRSPRKSKILAAMRTSLFEMEHAMRALRGDEFSQEVYDLIDGELRDDSDDYDYDDDDDDDDDDDNGGNHSRNYNDDRDYCYDGVNEFLGEKWYGQKWFGEKNGVATPELIWERKRKRMSMSDHEVLPPHWRLMVVLLDKIGTFAEHAADKKNRQLFRTDEFADHWDSGDDDDDNDDEDDDDRATRLRRKRMKMKRKKSKKSEEMKDRDEERRKRDGEECARMESRLVNTAEAMEMEMKELEPLEAEFEKLRLELEKKREDIETKKAQIAAKWAQAEGRNAGEVANEVSNNDGGDRTD